MKVGIVTFTYGDNYGQRLQNYAMQELLSRYADEVYTLRQIKPKVKLKTQVKQCLINIKERKVGLLKRRSKKFREFDEKYIHYYSEKIGPEKDFCSADNFDYFVVGSDQVWSPFSPDVNSSMFLEFAPNCKRISFSPSISAEEIPESKKEYYKRCWNSFKDLSVREYKGAKLIEELTGRKATVTLDPTLMFGKDFWEKRVKRPNKNIPQRYLLCYYLGITQQEKLINQLCRERNLIKIDVLNNRSFIDIDPFEFLYLIKNAEIVVTDSFHGTIFSILFKIPFVVCSRQGTVHNMESRFDTLNRMFNIQGRYASVLQGADIMKVDWDHISDTLESERKKSENYLIESLNLVENLAEDNYDF